MKVWFLEASSNVRKWRTNYEHLCKLINLYEKNQGVNSVVEMNNVNSVNSKNVLGLYWDHEKVIITLKINEVFKEAINLIPTKKKFLVWLQVFMIWCVIFSRQLLNWKFYFKKYVVKNRVGWWYWNFSK